ncbi:radical SAM/SPASM domain-containing protein [Paenibacillus ehimensis]|uniref:Radical SAM protein n=1 Tax=Paenibacillus ehimensis TaxID=79264 RepID=A0ABT8V478_9BACL|nr:radical SAM protein [Paenibacillus ehimensis]MDO3676224.1 radical SAM protein [Paenibacillus ehimensis]
MTNRWVSSRYSRVVRWDGTGGMIYNSFSGAMAAFEPDEEPEVRRIMERGALHEGMCGMASDLRNAGFLVPDGTDELAQAHKLHTALMEATSMHLVIMPTEACNFRCTYCYQSFPRGAMARGTIDGLKAYVRHAAAGLDHLAVSWFGGEPLLVPDTIAELSDSFLESCAKNGVRYSADMSTNGYFLTKERLMELVDRNVRRFMVTLDGTGAVHDRRRGLRGGGGTFESIIGNLKELRHVDESFAVDIRINFDENNADEVPDFLVNLFTWFGGDERFQLLIRPVGRWGGRNDDRIPVCDRTASDARLWELTGLGVEQGLALSETIIDTLMPSGAVCYAAKPNAFVIGADGRLYKCSVALEDPVNHVGQLHADGSMTLDADKMARWTGSGEERDPVCRACYFRPACQGNHCPLYRMRTGMRPCPHEKRKIKRVLELIRKSNDLVKGGEEAHEVDSSGYNNRSSGEYR